MSNPFSDSIRAAIYARDRGTCCVSGVNLWLLDAPLRTGWQSDWVDHIKPSSRGGSAEDDRSRRKTHETVSRKQSSISREVWETILADFAIRHPQR